MIEEQWFHGTQSGLTITGNVCVLRSVFRSSRCIECRASAIAEADAFQGANQGAVTVIRFGGQSQFKGYSINLGEGPCCEQVLRLYERVPMNIRTHTHLRCGERVALTRALEADVTTHGGVSATALVGGKLHGTLKPACPSCRYVLRALGVTDATQVKVCPTPEIILRDLQQELTNE